MKKNIALALALALACLMIPAWAEELTGEWYLTEIGGPGMSINPANMGMSVTMVLNADGTATVTSTYDGEPEVEQDTWTATETGLEMVSGESTLVFILEDGKLIADQEGSSMIFSREAPQAIVLPQAIAAETEDQFFGEWTLVHASFLGMTLSAADIGIPGESKVIIEAGKLTESTQDEDSDEAVLIDHETVFSDGKLLITGEEGEALITVELLEDGTLALITGDQGISLTLYFDRSAAQDAA